jgi:hypothetical protein
MASFWFWILGFRQGTVEKRRPETKNDLQVTLADGKTKAYYASCRALVPRLRREGQR